MKLSSALKKIAKLGLMKTIHGNSKNVYDVNGKKLKISCNPGQDDISLISVIKEHENDDDVIWTFQSLNKALSFCGI